MPILPFENNIALPICNRTGIRITLFFLLLFVSTFSQGQDFLTGDFVQVDLQDKTKFIGQVILNKPDSLHIKGEKSTIFRLTKLDIKRIKRLLPGEVRNGLYIPSNVNADKGTLVQNGFTLAKGEVYVQSNMLIWNEISAGITDRLSIRVGFETLSLIDRAMNNQNIDSRNVYNPFFLITTKYSIPIQKRYHLGISLTAANQPGSSAIIDYGFFFLSNTIGTPNNNFTIGLGTQLIGSGFRSNTFRRRDLLENSFFTFSASLKFTPKVSFITEHWFIIERNRFRYTIDNIPFFNSLGLKIHAKRASYMINIARGGEFGSSSNFWVPIPILGIAIPISRTWGS